MQARAQTHSRLRRSHRIRVGAKSRRRRHRAAPPALSPAHTLSRICTFLLQLRCSSVIGRHSSESRASPPPPWRPRLPTESMRRRARHASASSVGHPPSRCAWATPTQSLAPAPGRLAVSSAFIRVATRVQACCPTHPASSQGSARCAACEYGARRARLRSPSACVWAESAACARADACGPPCCRSSSCWRRAPRRFSSAGSRLCSAGRIGSGPARSAGRAPRLLDGRPPSGWLDRHLDRRAARCSVDALSPAMSRPNSDPAGPHGLRHVRRVEILHGWLFDQTRTFARGEGGGGGHGHATSSL